MERILGVEPWSEILSVTENSGGKICLGTKVSHHKMCNKCINCMSNG